jgi:uncharacterized protein
MEKLVSSKKQRRFGQDKLDSLPRYCIKCEVRFACNGECPKNRFMKTPDGELGLNYLCAGYKEFFRHIDGSMRFMANELRQGREPANVIKYTTSDRISSVVFKPGRNDPCPCGSGIKIQEMPWHYGCEIVKGWASFMCYCSAASARTSAGLDLRSAYKTRPPSRHPA